MRRKKTASSGPLCKLCGASNDTPFPGYPLKEGYKFGEICDECDTRDECDGVDSPEQTSGRESEGAAR